MMTNDNGMTSTDDKLEEALALLAAGIPADDILTEAGSDAEWLRPLLKIAADVGELKAAVPVPAPEASLQRMLAYGRELAAATPPPPVLAQQNWITTLVAFLSTGLPRLAAGLASALLLVVLLGGMVTVLAQRSLPGQPLYGLKRGVENVRLSLTLNPEDRTQLLETYNQQRQDETKLLLQQNEIATVSFSGLAEAVSETALTLDGLILQLTPQTQVKGTLAVGARVQVEALTQPPDHLTALTITVIEPAPPTPTPLPSPTAIPSPTPTATATATRSLSSDTDTLILPTLTPTPTPVPTDTPTPLPPLPTATPAPPPSDDNINGGGSDSSGDSGTNNGNENQNGPEDNSNGADNSNDNSGGDDSGGGDNSGGGNDNSGGGSDNSGGGGGDSGGGDDNSGHGSSNSGGGDDRGED